MLENPNCNYLFCLKIRITNANIKTFSFINQLYHLKFKTTSVSLVKSDFKAILSVVLANYGPVNDSMLYASPYALLRQRSAREEYNAQILLDARKNARLTQAELAERIGADKSYISRIERGITVPTVATLYRIAAAMGLTVELKPI